MIIEGFGLKKYKIAKFEEKNTMCMSNFTNKFVL